MKLDLLVLAAHPDDAELSCGGIILTHVAQGKQVGVVDLTRGELGTGGSAAIRAQESAKASAILGLRVRENLGMADGFFENDRAHQLMIIQAIRRYQPTVVLANAVSDRHPDHGRAAQLARDACFLSGLPKIQTFDQDGQPQPHWRPAKMYHYIQSDFLNPDLIVDISPFWTQKMEAILAYSTQFFNPNDPAQVRTFISKPEFLHFLEGRAREYGQAIGTEFGEGLIAPRKIGLKSLWDVIM